jgi:histidine triad (HIT) family protein
MSDCLFCRIVRKEIPASVVYEDDDLVVFNDINPQAPLHALIIPRRHIATLNDLSEADDALVGRMLRFAATIAAGSGYSERGYRTVFNCNREAGQSVFHIHLHLLAGRGLAWPPG